MTDDLIKRLSDEADLCRNDGADDIAALLFVAMLRIEAQAAEIAWLREDLGLTDAALRGANMDMSVVEAVQRAALGEQQ